ncbi:hypothetical protein D3C80_1545440 [compost metagenome]
MYLSSICSARRYEVLIFDFMSIGCILNILHHAAMSKHRWIVNTKQCALTQLSEGLLVAHHIICSTCIKTKEDVRLNQISSCAGTAKSKFLLNCCTTV